MANKDKNSKCFRTWEACHLNNCQQLKSIAEVTLIFLFVERWPYNKPLKITGYILCSDDMIGGDKENNSDGDDNDDKMTKSCD